MNISVDKEYVVQLLFAGYQINKKKKKWFNILLLNRDAKQIGRVIFWENWMKRT